MAKFNVNDFANYRVDVFGDEYEIAFFEKEETARRFAEMAKSEDNSVFILRKIQIGLYDVVDMA